MVEAKTCKKGKLLLPTSFLWLFFILSVTQLKVNSQEIYSLSIFNNNLSQNLPVKDTKNKLYWLKILNQPLKESEKATIFGYLAAQYREEGNFSEAISCWEKAIKIYEAQNNQKLLAKALTDQAQVYLSQGNFRKATILISSVIEIAEKIKDTTIQTVAWGVLGNTHFGQGNYNEALAAYQESFKQAEKINNSKYITIAANNLFSLFTARSTKYSTELEAAIAQEDKETIARLSFLANKDRKNALFVANRALLEADGGLPEFTALTNLLSLSPNSDYLARAQNILLSLPNSRNKAYAIVKLSKYIDSNLKIETLEWANSVAGSIGDSRAQSFALGEIGNVYEQSNQFDQALSFTQSAIVAAQRDGDSLYKWQWQAGRILTSTGNSDQAITAYKSAISTLQSIRSDIINASSDLQFDVRDEVEPVYRELITLLLDSGRVEEALPIFNLLKLTELQDFFGDECLEIASAIFTLQKSAKNSNDALIYSIILREKTYVILRLPNNTIKSYPVKLAAKELQDYIVKFRFALQESGNPEYLKLSKELYDLLIRPLKADLAISKPNNLVFVSDGVLQNLPMAALYDGKHFLVQNYSISTSLGLKLKISVQDKQRKSLIFGLTVDIPPFGSLLNVDKETQRISNTLGVSRFLDRDFTSTNLEKQIQQQKPSVIHIATHAFFGGTAQRTFLQAFDKRIALKEFEKIIRESRNSIDLLTLSACETASGDNRTTLGLAGIALRNNVKNILATLWSINDTRTVILMDEFYKQLNVPDTTEAEALRQAQIKMIEKNTHPSVWSSFILVSN